MSSIKRSSQGQSLVTEDKARGFGKAFAINLRIFQSRFADKSWARYFHFDLNAGSGYNDEADCIGSPLAFLSAVHRLEVTNYRAFFVDISRDAVSELLKRPEIASDERSFVMHGDNAEFVRAIPSIIEAAGDKAHMAIGSVLVDDNGTGIPIHELAALAAVCPRLDLFINITATGLKRAFQTRQLRLTDIITGIEKQHWLIREPLGQFQWTMLLGRNVQVNDHRAEGFYHLESKQGQQALERCNYTAAELRERYRKGQPELF